jgi:hypothetical protein
MTTTEISKKSGKGRSHGVVSELTAYLTVKPGHGDALRAALTRFGHATDAIEPDLRRRIGLRELRLVLFDDDRRMLFATGFETDWDPYIDDFVAFVGLEIILDWVQHIVEWPYPPGAPVTASSADVKRLLQAGQAQAVWFHEVFSRWTMPEILKAAQVQAAFQEVLDDPAAEEALRHPALKPLLALAAD